MLFKPIRSKIQTIEKLAHFLHSNMFVAVQCYRSYLDRFLIGFTCIPCLNVTFIVHVYWTYLGPIDPNDSLPADWAGKWSLKKKTIPNKSRFKVHWMDAVMVTVTSARLKNFKTCNFLRMLATFWVCSMSTSTTKLIQRP